MEHEKELRREEPNEVARNFRLREVNPTFIYLQRLKDILF